MFINRWLDKWCGYIHTIMASWGAGMGTTHTHNKDDSQNHDHVLSLVLGGSYMGACTWQSSVNWMLKFCVFYCRWIILGKIRPAQQLRAWDLELDCLEANPGSPHSSSGTFGELPKCMLQFPHLSNVTEISMGLIRLLWELNQVDYLLVLFELLLNKILK